MFRQAASGYCLPDMSLETSVIGNLDRTADHLLKDSAHDIMHLHERSCSTPATDSENVRIEEASRTGFVESHLRSRECRTALYCQTYGTDVRARKQ